LLICLEEIPEDMEIVGVASDTSAEVGDWEEVERRDSVVNEIDSGRNVGRLHRMSVDWGVRTSVISHGFKGA
jgi:hypothetical protein